MRVALLPDSCNTNKLPAVAPLPSFPELKRKLVKLEGAIRAVGELSFCGGDYYSYAPMDGSGLDLLNKDKTFGVVYKDFITGPLPGQLQTHGSFGVDSVTGNGHVFATNAWALSSEQGYPQCIDSWTGTKLLVPVGGLVPYPPEVFTENGYPVVVVTPVALAMLGKRNSYTTIQQYETTYNQMGIGGGKGEYGSGMINTDPIRLLSPNNRTAAGVKLATSTIVRSAQVLNILTAARALYECKPGRRLSNELFVQWAQTLLPLETSTSTYTLNAALADLCLNNTVSGAAVAALINVNQQLTSIENQYKKLFDNSAVPQTLFTDLVRIAQLAKVGQSILYNTIKQSCSVSGSSTSNFTPYVKALDALAESTAVNVDSIARALGITYNPAPASGSQPTTLEGALLNSGPVQSCVGVYAPVYTSADPLPLNTSAVGTFTVKSPYIGIYRFNSLYPGSICRDSVSNVVVSFPMSVKLPVTSKAAVTAISLMTRPASRDPEVVQKLGDLSALPVSLWNYAYGLFGYDASKSKVNFLTFEGDALNPGGSLRVAVLGSNALVMSTYSSALSLINGTFNGEVASDAIADAVVDSAYQVIAINGGNGGTSLINKDKLIQLYTSSYTKSMPISATGRHLAAASTYLTAAQLQQLFSRVAEVVVQSNARIQALVVQAKEAADEGRTVDTVSLLTQISQVAAVQQGPMAQSIQNMSNDIATKLTANSSYDISAVLEVLSKEYSGAAFDSLVASVPVNMENINSTADFPSHASSSPSLPASPSTLPTEAKYPENPQGSSKAAGVVAGAAVGSICGAIVIAVAIYFIHNWSAAKAAAAAAASGPSEAAPPVSADIFTEANAGDPADKYKVQQERGPSEEARPVGEGVEETTTQEAMRQEDASRTIVRSAAAVQVDAH